MKARWRFYLYLQLNEETGIEDGKCFHKSKHALVFHVVDYTKLWIVCSCMLSVNNAVNL